MNKYGVHFIPVHNRDDDYLFIEQFEPRIIKIVNPSPGHIQRIKSDLSTDAFLNTVFILRDHLLSEQKEEMARNPRALALEHTERLNELRTHVGLKDHPNTYVEGINEPNLDAGQRPDPQGDGYQSWLDKSKVLCSHVDIYTTTLAQHSAVIDQKIMAYLFSVGWPFNLYDGEPPYWGFFERSLDALEEYPHWIGLHEYWPQEGPSWNAGWFAYRWKAMPRDIPVAITECGLDEYVKDANVSDPSDRGWKNFMFAEKYTKQQHKYYRENLKDKRFEGQTPFTSDSADTWQSYDMLETYPHVYTMNWDITDINGPPVPPDPPLSEALIWPAIGITTQRFGEQYEQYMEQYGIAGHNGLDIANSAGTNLVAIADGIVQYSDWDDGGYGWYIRIWHQLLKMHSFYAHMKEQSPLAVHHRVTQGEIVGRMGNTGNSTGPHLHFELRAGSRYNYKDLSFGHTKGRFNPEIAYHILTSGSGEE